VAGTSLFQIIFVTANVTFLQAVQNHTVDIVLAMVLIIGGVIGAQLGGRMSSRVPAEQLRILLAVLILALGARLAFELVATPEDIYSIVVEK
jgi:uncharacterized protein